MSVIYDYLKSVNSDQKAGLERIRKIVHQTLPEAVEVITYGMPGFKYKGKYLIAFAPFKNHMSIFPGALPERTTIDRFVGFKTSKGTIQFTNENPIPKDIIIELIKIRAGVITKKQDYLILDK